MAILGALSIARSGLVSTGEALSITGNNIANVNTTGFKGSRAEFADLVAAHTNGASGLGTRLERSSTSFTQGGIESTGRATDLAIEGEGFFVVRNSDGYLYSRAGNFQINADGTLVTSTGDHAVQGFELSDGGQVIGAPVDITFGGATSQASPTTKVSLKNNLNAQAELFTDGFDSTSFDSAFGSSNFTTTARVYDSLGVAHALTFFFTRTDVNAWDVNVGIDGGENGGTAGELAILGTASLTFNTDGSLAGPDPTDIDVTFNGAADQTISLDFGTPNTDATPGTGLDGLTQFGSPSNAAATADGYAVGEFVTVEVDANGIVSGVFDNGQTRQLYRLALADFTATNGLAEIGGGLYQETSASGPAALSSPGGAGLGRIVGQAIERSNVDLAQEFVDLISLQRAFQANARVITTGDGLLNELINIVR